MGKYLLKRILIAIPVFICITFCVYFLISLTPTNIADVLSATQKFTPEEYQAAIIKYNLDKPIMYRYILWLKAFFQGDMGISYTTIQPVSLLIGQRLKASLILSITGMILGILIGIPLGIMAGYKPNSVWDHISNILSSTISAFPVFFMGLLLIFAFCVNLRIFPTFGMYQDAANPSFKDLVSHLILPASLIALQSVPTYVKQTRNALLEVIHEEYVKTAHSKGLSDGQVVLKHAFRNSLAPIITSITLSIPHCVAGSVVTEQIFSWPGMGSLMINSIQSKDYPTIMGITVLIAIAVLLAGILADVLYAAADPRVTFS